MPGIPDGVEELQKNIENILPCYLSIAYVYWYAIWAECRENRGWFPSQAASFRLTANVQSAFLVKLRLKEHMKKLKGE